VAEAAHRGRRDFKNLAPGESRRSLHRQ
jgi:hypothetical protein